MAKVTEEEKFPILGTTPGTLGALEAIKYHYWGGEPLVGRMLCFDGENMSFQEINVEKRIDRPICGSL